MGATLLRWEWTITELREWGLKDAEHAVRYAVKQGLIPKHRAMHEPGRPLYFTQKEVETSEYEPLVSYLPLLREKKREAVGLPPDYEPFEQQRIEDAWPPNDLPDTPSASPHASGEHAANREIDPILQRLERLSHSSTTAALSAEALELVTEQNHIIRELVRILISQWIALNPQDLEHYWNLWRRIYDRLG